MEIKVGKTTMENSIEVSLKIKIELLCNLAILFLGIYPKRMKTLTQKDIYTPNVHCSISDNSYDTERT